MTKRPKDKTGKNPPVISVKACDVTSVINLIDLMQATHAQWKKHTAPDHNYDIWFRGVCDLRNHRMNASFHRFRCQAGEDTTCAEFRESVAWLDPGGDLPDGWEIYATMQHYGVPTRLLDWTRT